MVLSAESRAKLSASKTGHEVTEETRAKIRATKAARPWKPSKAVRNKMSAASKGKPKSASHRANIAVARKGQPSPFQGTHSPESIEKMRESCRNRPRASCVLCHREMPVSNLAIHHRKHVSEAQG